MSNEMDKYFQELHNNINLVPHPIVNKNVSVISWFRNDNDFLSNFYECPLNIDGIEYNNAEAAFQSFKMEDKSQRIAFSNMKPREAKRFGKKVKLRSDWEHIKLAVMYLVVYSKFSQNEGLKKKLLNTGNTVLIEGNSWNDTYWGVCGNKGRNKLGIILMLVRNKLRQE